MTINNFCITILLGCLLLILQPLFADGLALNADAGQAGAWAMLYRYGSIGVAGLWTACLLMPQRVVRQLPDIAAVVLMGCVIWEAVVALNQLYGDGMSNHALYRFTGTFLNPGPFCGFMAIGVPLAVHYLVKSDKLRATSDEIVQGSRFKVQSATSDELRATSGPFGASSIEADWYVRLNTSGNCNQGRHTGLPLRWSLVVLAPLLYWGMKNAEIWQARYDAAKEWRNARSLYHIEAYSIVCEDYAPLYERMRWNHNYLFEYGRALHQTERYEESNRILQEAERICGDPMILNIQGKNYEALGTYDQAARLYQRAYNRLPNRLYPLYLEMEMYASPKCNRPEEAKRIACRILDTEEKIPSQAVEEIKKRAREVSKGR